MIERGTTFTTTITMVTEICCNCGLPFALPSDLQKTLKNDSSIYFYCPRGHSQHYTGKSDEQKLKEAQAKLEQREKELRDEQTQKWEAQRKLIEAERKLKRIHKGVCPCCNRSFENLRRHMETKHPEELKNFIELINAPNFKKQDGVVYLNLLTAGEKRKLKHKQNNAE